MRWIVVPQDARTAVGITGQSLGAMGLHGARCALASFPPAPTPRAGNFSR